MITLKTIFRSVAGISVCAMFFLNSGQASAQSIGGEDANSCKWKRASCGLFQGTYEACLTNGDGNACEWGAVTRIC